MSSASDDWSVQETEPAIAGRPVRRLFREGEYWTVREIDAPSFDRRRTKHLVFETAYVMRRVRTFPANWTELAEDALFALSMEIRPDPK